MSRGHKSLNWREKEGERNLRETEFFTAGNRTKEKTQSPREVGVVRYEEGHTKKGVREKGYVSRRVILWVHSRENFDGAA